MAVRYTVTDSAGVTHTRTSRGHLKPLYFFAVVRKPGSDSKRFTSFHGTDRTAQSALNAAMKPMVGNSYTREQYPERIGKPIYPGAAIYSVTAEVL